MCEEAEAPANVGFLTKEITLDPSYSLLIYRLSCLGGEESYTPVSDPLRRS